MAWRKKYKVHLNFLEHCTLHVSRLNQSRLMAMKLMVAPDLKTYLTYSIEFWRLIKSKEKLIPQYDNCMPRRHLYEIFADWPRSPKKRVSCSSLTIMAIPVVEFHVRGDKIQYYIFAKIRHTTYSWNIMCQIWEGDCGLWVLNEILFKNMLKVWKKSWEPFGSCLLNSTANPANPASCRSSYRAHVEKLTRF